MSKIQPLFKMFVEFRKFRVATQLRWGGKPCKLHRVSVWIRQRKNLPKLRWQPTNLRVDDYCGLTACTPGSAPGSTLGNDYVNLLPFYDHKSSALFVKTQCSVDYAVGLY